MLVLLQRSDRVHLQLTGILTVTMTMIPLYRGIVLKDKLLIQEITDVGSHVTHFKACRCKETF